MWRPEQPVDCAREESGCCLRAGQDQQQSITADVLLRHLIRRSFVSIHGANEIQRVLLGGIVEAVQHPFACEVIEIFTTLHAIFGHEHFSHDPVEKWEFLRILDERDRRDKAEYGCDPFVQLACFCSAERLTKLDEGISKANNRRKEAGSGCPREGRKAMR